MRFQDQINIIENNKNNLKIEYEQINGTQNFRVKKLDILSDALETFNRIEYLKKDVQIVINTEIVNNVIGGTAIITNQKLGILTNALNTLKNSVNQALVILKSVVKETNENTICIKLIEYGDLEQIGEELCALNRIFQQVITNKAVDGSYSFHSFDIGSTWVNIVTKGTVTLSLIAGLAWSACVVRNKYLQGEYIKKQIELYDIKKEFLEDLEKAQKKQLDLLVTSEAKGLIEKFNLDDTDVEYEKRLKNSISELSKMINDGVQVVPSLVAPEESKNLFPDYSSLETLVSQRKLLEDKTGAEKK